MGGVSKYLAFQDGVSEYLGRAISWSVLLMIAVLVYEIFSRYIFGSPTEWAHESSTMLYGSYCILAGAYTMRHQSHVRSDVFYGRMSPRIQALLDVISQTLALLCLAVFFKLSLDFALESWAAQEYSSKSTWQPPVYPFKAVVPTAVAFVFLQMVAELVRSALTLAGVDFVDPRSDEDETEVEIESLKPST